MEHSHKSYSHKSVLMTMINVVIKFKTRKTITDYILFTLKLMS